MGSDKGERATLLRPGQGEPLSLRGADMCIKAGAEAAGGAFSFIESRDPAGFAAAPHIHHEAVEALYVVDGEYVFQAADEERQLGVGGFVLSARSRDGRNGVLVGRQADNRSHPWSSRWIRTVLRRPDRVGA